MISLALAVFACSLDIKVSVLAFIPKSTQLLIFYAFHRQSYRGTKGKARSKETSQANHIHL